MNVFFSGKDWYLRFLDLFSSLSFGFKKLTILWKKHAFKVTKYEVVKIYSPLTKKLAFPCEYFEEIECYDKPVNGNRKEINGTKLNGNLDDEELGRRNTMKKLNHKLLDNLIFFYNKSDGKFLVDI